jgi:hypothetical protein
VVSVSASGTIERNVESYALGHASRFGVPGARRIAATSTSSLIETVAFKNPDGTKVLIALNEDDSARSLSVLWGGESFCYTLAAGAVATFTWRGEPTPAPLELPHAPASTLEPIAMPNGRLWARLRRWVGDQLQSLEPLIARRLGRRELLALSVGSAFLAFLVYRRIRRMRLRQ